MRKVILYIAMSLDGYIADRDGRVDWLNGDGSGESIDTYSAFIQEIDTAVMGWKTYHQIVTELSPDEWPYKGLTSYVITHRTLPSTDEIKFTGEDPRELAERLRKGRGKGIWICGGGSVVQPLVGSGLIDEYHIAVIPAILGSGVRLFGETAEEVKLKLLRTQEYNGITELTYTRR